MRHAKRWALLAAAAIGGGLSAPAPALAYVYWGHNNYGLGIGRSALDGSGANDAFIPQPAGAYAFTAGVATDGVHLYAGVHGAGSTVGNTIGPPNIWRAKVDGTAFAPFSQATGHSVSGVGVTATHVYWTSPSLDTSSVGRTPIIGGQQFQSISSTFGEPNPRSCGVAADDTWMYFANPTTYSIGRAELATMGTPSQVVEGEWIKLPTGHQPCGVAIDGDSIYWGTLLEPRANPGDPTSPPGRGVYRADKATGLNSKLLSDGGDEISGVAVFGDYVYFVNHATYRTGAGSIKRASKDGSGSTLTLVSGLSSAWGVAVDAGGTPPPPPPPASAVPLAPPDALSVVCNACSYSPPGPPEVRPDFSRVWTTKKIFAPASWSTPLLSVAGTKAATRSTREARDLRTAAGQSSAEPTSGTGGTAFNYVLPREATVKITLSAVSVGRTKGKTCKRPTPKTRKAKRCDLLKPIATLTRTSHAGTNVVPFSGRIRGKAFKPGKYRAVFTASVGAVSAEAKSVDFRIAADKRP